MDARLPVTVLSVFLGAGNITQWAYALPTELGGEPV